MTACGSRGPACRSRRSSANQTFQLLSAALLDDTRSLAELSASAAIPLALQVRATALKLEDEMQLHTAMASQTVILIAQCSLLPGIYASIMSAVTCYDAGIMSCNELLSLFPLDAPLRHLHRLCSMARKFFLPICAFASSAAQPEEFGWPGAPRLQLARRTVSRQVSSLRCIESAKHEDFSDSKLLPESQLQPSAQAPSRVKAFVV